MKTWIILLLSTHSLTAQTIVEPPKVDIERKKAVVAIWTCGCGSEAEFPGGIAKLHQYLQDNLKLSGLDDFNEHSADKLYVEFIVDEYGEIDYPTVKNLENTAVSEEIDRVFCSMPRWTARELECEFVRTKLVIPISINWMDPLANH